MMTYDLLAAKLILEKTKKSKNNYTAINNIQNKSWLRFFPFLDFQIDLTTPTDWDLDS